MTMSKPGPAWTSVRLSDEAVRLARIASGYKGEALGAYASRILIEAAKHDIEKEHAALVHDTDTQPKRAKRGKGSAP